VYRNNLGTGGKIMGKNKKNKQTAAEKNDNGGENC